MPIRWNGFFPETHITMKITKEAKKDGNVLWTAEVSTDDIRNLSDSDLALVVAEALDQFSYRTGKASKKLKEIDDTGDFVTLDDILEILRESGNRDSGPSKEDKANAKAFMDKVWAASAPLAEIAKRHAHCRSIAERRDTAMAAGHTGGLFWNAGRQWDTETLAEMFRHHRVSVDRDTRRKKAAQAALDGEDLSPPTTIMAEVAQLEKERAEMPNTDNDTPD